MLAPTSFYLYLLPFYHSNYVLRGQGPGCVHRGTLQLRIGRHAMAIIAMMLRTVNVAELKNHLSKYLAFVKGGAEIVIRDRNLPVAKLVPFVSEAVQDEELLLVTAGKMRLPKTAIKVDELLKIPTGRVDSSAGIQAVVDERDEGW